MKLFLAVLATLASTTSHAQIDPCKISPHVRHAVGIRNCRTWDRSSGLSRTYLSVLPDRWVDSRGTNQEPGPAEAVIRESDVELFPNLTNLYVHRGVRVEGEPWRRLPKLKFLTVIDPIDLYRKTFDQNVELTSLNIGTTNGRLSWSHFEGLSEMTRLTLRLPYPRRIDSNTFSNLPRLANLNVSAPVFDFSSLGSPQSLTSFILYTPKPVEVSPGLWDRVNARNRRADGKMFTNRLQRNQNSLAIDRRTHDLAYNLQGTLVGPRVFLTTSRRASKSKTIYYLGKRPQAIEVHPGANSEEIELTAVILAEPADDIRPVSIGSSLPSDRAYAALTSSIRSYRMLPSPAERPALQTIDLEQRFDVGLSSSLEGACILSKEAGELKMTGVYTKASPNGAGWRFVWLGHPKVRSFLRAVAQKHNVDICGITNPSCAEYVLEAQLPREGQPLPPTP
jgi:hypothetical protein